MKNKNQSGESKMPPKAKLTASKEEIKQIFEKAVRTHGKTLERLSKS